MRKIGRLCGHLSGILAALLVLLVLPYLHQPSFRLFLEGKKTDTVSSATVLLDAPGGNFYILLNPKLHTDQKKREQWVDFFQGKDVSFIFEDLSCSVARADSAAVDMAKSFQSRLPQNQMKLLLEDTAMLRSRVQAGKYDVVLVSKEFCDAAMNQKQWKGILIPYSKEGEK